MNADTAADVDDAVDAANAVVASPFPDDGAFNSIAWVIALLAPLIALILIILIEKQHFAVRWLREPIVNMAANA